MANSSDNFYSESALVKLEDGKEYRKRLFTETQQVLANLLDVLPSVYTATIPSTNYGTHLKRIAIEIARLKIEADNIQKDTSIDTVRSQYLYQKFGYQVQVNNTFFPISSFSDTDYRNFLKAVLYVLFHGSTLENIKYALQVITKVPIDVRDTTSSRGVLRYSYIDKFQNGKLALKGTAENLKNIRLSTPDGASLYTLATDYYNSTPTLTELVILKTITIPNNVDLRVEYDYQDALVDQFRLKVSFNLSSLSPDRNRAEDIIQQCRFLLHLIKPAHVLADIRIYEKDIFGKPLELFTSATQDDLYLALDEVTTQKFIHHSYDDFRRYTRDASDTQVIEFNNIETVMNKISETYGDVGYYFNEADPLYLKRYNLFQLKGIASQSSSLMNSPASLEFNEPQTSLFNNVSSFNQTLRNRTIHFPEIEINEDLPVRDYVVSEEEVKVSALSLDFGVSVSAGTIYSYTQAAIVTLDTPISLVLPSEVAGELVFIYIDLSSPTPVLDYKVSEFGLYDVTVPSIALAQIRIPIGASVIWDMDITDLRIHSFINLSVTGDPSGFSRFNVNRGIILGDGTRPIHYKFDANQSNAVYQVEGLSELCNTSFDLNSNFVLGEAVTGYTADDLNFLYADLDVQVQKSTVGSVPTPCFEGALILGIVFGPENEADRVRIFDEDTLFIFNDTLPRAEQIVVDNALDPISITFDGILEESFRLYNSTTSAFLVAGSDFVLDLEALTLTFLSGVSDGDVLVAYFYQPFGTLLNQNLLYGSNTTYATFDFTTFSADELSAVEEEAQVGVGIGVIEYLGVQVSGILFNTAVLATGTVTGIAFPTGIALILNDFDSLLNQEGEEVVTYVSIFDESQPSLLNADVFGPIEQLALEGVSIIDQSTGLPVIALDGNPVT